MKKNQMMSKAVTLCYFGLYIIIALSFLFRQPFGSPPDEFNRYLIPQYIAENNSLPNGYDEAIRIPGYGFSYAFQPILPYIFQGWIMRLVGLFTENEAALLYGARFVNFLFGLVMAFFVLKLAREWFQEECWQWLFAFLVTFLPQSIFVHTYVNTDSCCMLSTVLMLYGLTCGLKQGFNCKNSVIMAAGIILCALSYYNAYGFILSCILLFMASFLSRIDGRFRFDWRQFIKKGAFISMLVILGIGWWFIRSALLYEGDFLGLRAREYCASLYADPAYHPDTRITWESQGYSVAEMLLQSNFIQLSQLSFIGIFGAMSIPTSIWVYRFYRVFFFAGVLLSAVLVPGNWFKEDNALLWETGKKKLLRIFFHGNMVFCILMPFILSVRYSYITDYQPQGRYLLPTLVPLGYYCVRGFKKLFQLKRLNGVKQITSGRLPCVLAAVLMGLIVVCLLVSVYGYVFEYYAANPGAQ